MFDYYGLSCTCHHPKFFHCRVLRRWLPLVTCLNFSQHWRKMKRGSADHVSQIGVDTDSWWHLRRQYVTVYYSLAVFETKSCTFLMPRDLNGNYESLLKPVRCFHILQIDIDMVFGQTDLFMALHDLVTLPPALSRSAHTYGARKQQWVSTPPQDLVRHSTQFLD